MQAKSPHSGSNSPALSAGEDPRDSELLQVLNTNNWLNGSRQYRHKALAQFVSKNTRYVRVKLQGEPVLRQQFFSALAGCELEQFKILIKFIAQSRVLTQELKALLTDIMNKNSFGYSDPQWNKSLFRSTLAGYLVHTDTIANALLSYSDLHSTDPAFVARVLLNKIGAPTLYFDQIDSYGWHFVNFLKGLVQRLLPSFLFSFKNPPIPTEVLMCLEEAPRDLASAKAEASSNAAKISITFNKFGWSKPKEETGPREDSTVSAFAERQPSLTARQFTAEADATFIVATNALLMPAAVVDLNMTFNGLVPPSPIRGNGTASLHSDDEVDFISQVNH